MKRKMITRIVAVLTLSAVMATNSMMTMGNVYANELTEGAEQQEYETLAVDSDYSQIGGVESYIVDGNKVTFKMVTGEYVRVSLLDNDVIRLYMDIQWICVSDKHNGSLLKENHSIFLE